MLRTNLANVHLRGGRREEARTEYQHAIDIGVRTLGSEHPRVLLARSNLVGALQQLGLDRLARAEIEQVLAAQKRTVGEQHLQQAQRVDRAAGAGDGQHEVAFGLVAGRRHFAPTYKVATPSVKG